MCISDALLPASTIPCITMAGVAQKSIGVSAAGESNGLTRLNGKCSFGLTLSSWKASNPLTSDVTVACTLAVSYVNATSRSHGAAAELAALRKSAKYAYLDGENTYFSNSGLPRFGYHERVILRLYPQSWQHNLFCRW